MFFSVRQFGLGVAPESVLPVELLSFTGVAKDNTIRLKWSTATELNNDFFDVQRSRDGVEFESIGRVEGNGTTNSVTEYQFVDIDPGLGDNFYRLRQVDFDGTQEYHKIINVTNDFFMDGIEVAMYPNPTKGNNLNIRLVTGDDFNPIYVRLLDLKGQVYFEKSYKASLQINERVAADRELRNGVYFLIIKQGDQTVEQKLIVK